MNQYRKLQEGDEQRIRFYYTQNLTIREMAVEYGVTPKYIKKIIMAHTDTTEAHFDCSGCGREFTRTSTLQDHYSVWTSGNNDLSCQLAMPAAYATP